MEMADPKYNAVLVRLFTFLHGMDYNRGHEFTEDELNNVTHADVAQNDVNRTMLTFDRSKYRHYQSYRMKHHQMYNQPWKHHSVHIPLLSMFCGMSGNMVLVVENQQVNLQGMNAA